MESTRSLTPDQRIDQANRSALAREVGVSRAFASQVLSGKNTPSFDVAAKMASVLGVSLDDFYRSWRSRAVAN